MNEHIYAGSCPDENQPAAFDPNCPECVAQHNRLALLVMAAKALEGTLAECGKCFSDSDTKRRHKSGRAALAAINEHLKGKP